MQVIIIVGNRYSLGIGYLRRAEATDWTISKNDLSAVIILITFLSFIAWIFFEFLKSKRKDHNYLKVDEPEKSLIVIV